MTRRQSGTPCDYRPFSPTGYLGNEPGPEHLLDRYGIAFVCANPQILLPTCTGPLVVPNEPQERLECLLAGYRLLDEIYAPHTLKTDRSRSKAYEVSGIRFF